MKIGETHVFNMKNTLSFVDTIKIPLGQFLKPTMKNQKRDLSFLGGVVRALTTSLLLSAYR